MGDKPEGPEPGQDEVSAPSSQTRATVELSLAARWVMGAELDFDDLESRFRQVIEDIPGDSVAAKARYVVEGLAQTTFLRDAESVSADVGYGWATFGPVIERTGKVAVREARAYDGADLAAADLNRELRQVWEETIGRCWSHAARA